MLGATTYLAWSPGFDGYLQVDVDAGHDLRDAMVDADELMAVLEVRLPERP